MSDKLLLHMTRLTKHSDQILRNIDTCDSQSRNKIHKEIKKLKKLVNKYFGHEEAFDELSSKDPTFIEVAKKMQSIEEKIAKIEASEKSAQTSPTNLGTAVSTPIEVKLTFESLTAVQQKGEPRRSFCNLYGFTQAHFIKASHFNFKRSES